MFKIRLNSKFRAITTIYLFFERLKPDTQNDFCFLMIRSVGMVVFVSTLKPKVCI